MEMKQSNDHILREYYISKVFAICFTFMYLIVCSIIFKADQKIVSDDIVIVASLLFYLLPLAILISWDLCVERYIHLNLIHGEAQDRERKHRQLKILVTVVSIGGLIYAMMEASTFAFLKKVL